MSDSIIRTIRLLEVFAAAPPAGLTAIEAVEQSGLPSSTAYRMIGDMESAGFLYRGADRRLFANFSFERRIALGKISPARLQEACAEISRTLGAASEIILLRGHNLLWHIKEEHPLQPLRLRAHPGYVRSTYELDSISRLALAHQPLETIAATWDKAGFYEVGVSGGRLSWEDACRTLAQVDVTGMQYDLQGNAKGVRRFSVAVADEGGMLVCLLTAAEAAVPMRDEAAHIRRIEDVLLRAREGLADGGAGGSGNAEGGRAVAG